MAILEDSRGVVWAGTVAGGLNRLDRQAGTVQRYRHRADQTTGLCNDRIWSLYADRRGLLWIGTDGGLCAFDRRTNRFRAYGLPSTAQPWIQAVHALREDQAGRDARL